MPYTGLCTFAGSAMHLYLYVVFMVLHMLSGSALFHAALTVNFLCNRPQPRRLLRLRGTEQMAQHMDHLTAADIRG
jgi:hypothetical protein